MPKTIVAQSPVDVMLGEVSYRGTPAQIAADMLGVASVMYNRAALTQTSIEDAVSVRSQFNAYGQPLPGGVEAYRNLAQSVFDRVTQYGPATTATYYSTPSTAKNLPRGLTPVDETIGHVYQTDPQNRAIVTRQGAVRPSQSILDGLQNAVAVAQQSYRAAQQAPPDVEEAPSGIAAVAGTGSQPNTRVGGNLTSSLYGRRSEMPSSGIAQRVADIANQTIPGVTTNIYSGQEPPGVAPVNAPGRHPIGVAGDFNFNLAGRPLSGVPLQDIAMNAAAQQMNIGFAPNYMGNYNMHIDQAIPNPAAPGTFWGKTRKNAPDDPNAFNLSYEGQPQGNLDFAREMGPSWRNPPTFDAPTPFGAGETNPNVSRMRPSAESEPLSKSYQSMGAALASVGRRGVGGEVAPANAAPVGRVTRSALAPAAPNPANRPMGSEMVAGMDRALQNMRQAPAPAPGNFGGVTAAQAAPVKSATVSKMLSGMDSPVYGPSKLPGRTVSTPGPVQGPPMPAPKPEPTVADLAKAYSAAQYQRAMPAPTQPKPLQGPPMPPAAPTTLNEVAQTVAPKQTIAPPQVQQAPVQARPRQTIQAPPPVQVQQPRPRVAPAIANRIAPAIVGGLLGGPVGAIAGAVMGNPLGGLGALFNAGVPQPQRYSIGTGTKAISSILNGGGTAGATAYSRSTPGYSVTNLGNGYIEKTNQYGVKSYQFTGYPTSLAARFGFNGGGSGRASSISPAASRATGGGTHAPSKGGLY